MESLEPALLGALLDGVDDGLYVADAATGRLLDVNAAACRMLGYDRDELMRRGLAGIKAPDLVGPEGQLERQVESLRALGSFIKSTRHQRADGTTFPVEVRIYLREHAGREYLLGVVRSLEPTVGGEQSELRSHERLTSMAQVAARLGHQLNNPLSYVAGSLDVARQHVDERTPDALREALDDVRRGVERISGVLRDLDVLSRGVGVPERLDPVPVIRAALRHVEPKLPAGTRVDLHLAEGLRVSMRQADLREVMIQLLDNAADALRDGARDPVVEITARRGSTGTVVIAVSDTGAGFGEDVGAQLFDPFFTTKPGATSSGLGLTVCQRWIIEAGGHIQARGVPGMGATVAFELPSDDRASARPPTQVEARGARVLIVDDEPLIGLVLRKMLSEWDVSAVQDPLEAVSRITADPPEVVICDLVMDELDGRSLYERAVAARPELAERFVFITAGAISGELRDFADGLGERCLRKPIDRVELVDRVRAVLAG